MACAYWNTCDFTLLGAPICISTYSDLVGLTYLIGERMILVLAFLYLVKENNKACHTFSEAHVVVSI